MNIPGWLLATAVMATAAGMLFGLRAYKLKSGADPEWVRKLAHIGTGILSLSLPWIFHTRLPVFVVCGAAVALTLSLRYSHLLKSHMGGVLDGVARESGGEVYFPFAVAVLYAEANGDKLLFSIPILMLTFADAVAALAGTQYGKHAFKATGGTKTTEGSIAFFTVGFMTVHVPLLLFSNIGRAETLVIALTMAILVMMLEAIAWRGLDNIFIPLGGFVMLKIYLHLSLPELLARLIIATGMLFLVRIYRKRTTLEGSALICTALILYLAWALGGWTWLLAPATVFLVYSSFYPGKIPAEDKTYNGYVIVSVASAGLIWLFLAKAWGQPSFFFPYMVGFAVNLAIIGWTLTCMRFPNWRPRVRLVVIIFKSWFIIFAPYVLINGRSRTAMMQAILALAICITSVVLFLQFQKRAGDATAFDGPRWLRQAGVVFGGTLLALLAT